MLWSRPLLLTDRLTDSELVIRGNCGHETERIEVHHIVVQSEGCKYRTDSAIVCAFDSCLDCSISAGKSHIKKI